MNDVRRREILGPIIVCLTVIVHSSILFRYCFPLSEGWFVNYVELVNIGKVPYKDFYYYLPPFNLLLDCIIWKLSFGYLLMFRAWYVFERTIIYWLLYRLMRRQYGWKESVVSISISAIICSSDLYDFLGDYNQHVVLLTILIIYYCIDFSNLENRNKYISFFKAGCVFGFLFLTKPTNFLAGVILFGGVFAYLCYKQNDKNFYKYLMTIICGGIIPIAMSMAYLLYTNSFFDFIQQVFLNTESKGNFFDFLIGNFSSLLDNIYPVVIAILLYIVLSNIRNADFDKIENNKPLYIVMLIMCLVGVSIFKILYFCNSFFINYKVMLLTIFFIGGVVFVSIVAKNNKLILAWCICLIVLFVLRFSDEWYLAANEKNIIFYFSDIICPSFLWFSCIELVSLLKGDKLSDTTDTIQLIWIFTGGISLAYASSMAAGRIGLPTLSMRVLVPFVLVNFIVIVEKEKSEYTFLFKTIIISCIMACFASTAAKLAQPYPWWGCIDYPREEKNYYVDIKAMKGIKVTAEEKEMYEEINNIITHYCAKDDVIFGYPYILIYNILSNNYNEMYAPVVWYDVISDSAMKRVVDDFVINPPKIVLWKMIPSAKETHEDLYRHNKPLVQRELEEVFAKMINENKYIEIATYNSITVYLRAK